MNNVTVSTISGPDQRKMATLELEVSPDGQTWHKVPEALTMKNFSFGDTKLQWSEYVKKDPVFEGVIVDDYDYEEIDLFIGNNKEKFFLLINGEENRQCDKNGVLALKTQLGWTIAGPLQAAAASTRHSCHMTIVNVSTDILQRDILVTAAVEVEKSTVAVETAAAAEETAAMAECAVVAGEPVDAGEFVATAESTVIAGVPVGPGDPVAMAESAVVAGVPIATAESAVVAGVPIATAESAVVAGVPVDPGDPIATAESAVVAGVPLDPGDLVTTAESAVVAGEPVDAGEFVTTAESAVATDPVDPRDSVASAESAIIAGVPIDPGEPTLTNDKLAIVKEDLLDRYEKSQGLRTVNRKARKVNEEENSDRLTTTSNNSAESASTPAEPTNDVKKRQGRPKGVQNRRWKGDKQWHSLRSQPPTTDE